MYNESILFVIPARAGSKRLHNKNKLLLAGKPLICWSIDAALGSRIDAPILVTSDDPDIWSLCKGYDNEEVFVRKRPSELATDEASTASAVLDALDYKISMGYNPETVILLQPTSPLRTSKDIEIALKIYLGNEYKWTTVSVCKLEHPSSWIGRIDENNELTDLKVAMQGKLPTPNEYRLNGAIYIFDVKNFVRTRKIFTKKISATVMPRERSVDIDDRIDFQMSEYLLKN